MLEEFQEEDLSREEDLPCEDAVFCKFPGFAGIGGLPPSLDVDTFFESVFD